jgi:hypothetical protein
MNLQPIVETDTTSLFAGVLSEQIANMIKGRGHRAHMITRDDAKGKDVWEGYEEDPLLALGQYARGIAAGEGKKLMAMDIVKAFTGTEITWDEFAEIQTHEGDYESFIARPDINNEFITKEIFDKYNTLEAVDEEGVAWEREREDPDMMAYHAFVSERRIDAKNQPNAFKDATVYMEDMLRNEEAVDRIIGTLKGLGVLKYLAGRVSAPMVNLTAMATSVPGVMSGEHGIPINKAYRLIGRAVEQYGRYKFGKPGAIDPDRQALFEEIEQKGWHSAQYNREALSALQSKVGKGYDKLIEWSMFAFGATEQLNRVSTIVATYEGLRSQDTSLSHEEALQKAKTVSDMSHGTYGKANRPFFARGGHLGAQVAQMFYVFRTFSHNYLLTMSQLWGRQLKPKHLKAFTYMLMSPAVLAGAGATIATPVLSAMIKALPGDVGGDDPEEEFYKWMMDNMGENAEMFARYGMFGVAGLNLKGSLQMGIGDIPTTIPELLGAPGSIITDVASGIVNITKGEFAKGAEQVLPLAVGNIIKGMREYRQGVTTRTNAPIFFGDEPLKADFMDAVYRSMSFSPASISRAREILWKETKRGLDYTKRRADIYAKMRKFFLRPEAERDKTDFAELLEEVQEYNDRVKRNELAGVVPFITGTSIRTNMRRAFTPSKKEKLRSER